MVCKTMLFISKTTGSIPLYEQERAVCTKSDIYILIDIKILSEWLHGDNELRADGDIPSTWPGLTET